MWQYQQIRLLNEEIISVISSLPEDLRNLVTEPLTLKRRGLCVASKNDSPWVLLPILIYDTICKNTENAIPLCASLQFFMAAGDVLDDIEDDDSSLSLCTKYGKAISNNIATLLIMLGEKTISRLRGKDFDEKTIFRILDIINSYYVKACIGQHLDLIEGNNIDIIEDEYLNILSLKSASQVECACYTGALLATNDNKLLDAYKDFGYNLGMMAQIVNDISGILTKKDIQNRKITLPVIYAINQSNDHDMYCLKNYYLENTDKISTEQIKQILSNTGAIHYTAIKMEYYKLFASKYLNNVKQAGINVNKLRVFFK